MLAIAVGLAVVLGMAAWANALTQPVVRAGVPTGTVEPPRPSVTPVPTTVRPTVTPTATPSGTSARPTPTATPTATPTKPVSAPPRPTATKPADPFATSTVTQETASGEGTLHSFVVKVEKATGLAVNPVASEIADTLNDPRGWAGDGTVRFALVRDPKKADFVVYVSTPPAADTSCSKAAAVCVAGAKVVLAAVDWKTPAPVWGSDVTGFRRYLVNNAVGRFLDRPKASCTKAGRPAPVMADQTTDLKGCTPNPWPNG